METFTSEIKNCLSAKLWYAALVLSLLLPDICAALESADGQTDAARYKAWFNFWLKGKFLDTVTDVDMYYLRCGVAHQGKFEHPAIQYRRIFFTLHHVPGGRFFHDTPYPHNVAPKQQALNLDLEMFCNNVIESVEAWFAQKQNDPYVQANLVRLVQFHPNGLLPYLKDVPAVG